MSVFSWPQVPLWGIPLMSSGEVRAAGMMGQATGYNYMRLMWPVPANLLEA